MLIINYLSDIAASEAIVKDEIVGMWKDITAPPRNTREAGVETTEDKLNNRRNRSSSTKKILIEESNNTVSETDAENQQIEIHNMNEEKDKGVESSEASSTKEDSGFDEIEPVTGVSTPLQGQIEDMQPERNMENDAEITEKKEAMVERSAVKNTESRKSRSPQKTNTKSKDLRPKSKQAKNKNQESRKASPLKRNPSKSGTKQSASVEQKTNATSESKTEEVLQELSNNKEELTTGLVTEDMALNQEKGISSGETALQCSENENISCEAQPGELENHIDNVIREENGELNKNDDNEEVGQHEEEITKETLNRSQSITKEKRTRSKSPKKDSKGVV